jgi:hypothetical protein
MIWKLFMLTASARRGWKRIPPQQRRQIVETAGRTVRAHGPTVAKRLGAAVRQARGPR